MFDTKKVQLPFLSSLVILGLIFAIVLFRPFFAELFIAVVIATILYPVYAYVTHAFGGKRTLAAGCVVLITFLFVVGPLSFLGIQLFNETQNVYTSLQSGEYGSVEAHSSTIEKAIKKILPKASIDVDLRKYGQKMLAWIETHIGTIATGTVQTLFSLFLILFGLFFFLRDGNVFIKFLMSISPLDSTYNEKIVTQLRQTSNAVVRGRLLIALIQGTLAGLGMWFFGVPNATLLGSLSAITALIPTVGTGVVLIPVVIYLFITGKALFAFGLLLWGVLVVGLIDNFLMPFFYSGKHKIHPLLVLFSAFGGLVVFGPVGFLVGPIGMGLFLTIIDIYQDFLRQER